MGRRRAREGEGRTRQVDEAVVLDELGALGALACGSRQECMRASESGDAVGGGRRRGWDRQHSSRAEGSHAGCESGRTCTGTAEDEDDGDLLGVERGRRGCVGGRRGDLRGGARGDGGHGVAGAGWKRVKKREVGELGRGGREAARRRARGGRGRGEEDERERRRRRSGHRSRLDRVRVLLAPRTLVLRPLLEHRPVQPDRAPDDGHQRQRERGQAQDARRVGCAGRGGSSGSRGSSEGARPWRGRRGRGGRGRDGPPLAPFHPRFALPDRSAALLARPTPPQPPAQPRLAPPQAVAVQLGVISPPPLLAPGHQHEHRRACLPPPR